MRHDRGCIVHSYCTMFSCCSCDSRAYRCGSRVRLWARSLRRVLCAIGVGVLHWMVPCGACPVPPAIGECTVVPLFPSTRATHKRRPQPWRFTGRRVSVRAQWQSEGVHARQTVDTHSTRTHAYEGLDRETQGSSNHPPTHRFPVLPLVAGLRVLRQASTAVLLLS